MGRASAWAAPAWRSARVSACVSAERESLLEGRELEWPSARASEQASETGPEWPSARASEREQALVLKLERE